MAKVVTAWSDARHTIVAVQDDGSVYEFSVAFGWKLVAPPIPAAPPEPPVIVADAGPWKCDECGVRDNYAADTRCHACGQPRPATQGTR